MLLPNKENNMIEKPNVIMFRIVVCIVLLLGLYGASAKAESNKGNVILDTASFWRCRMVRGTDLVRTADGKLVHIHPAEPTKRASKVVDGKRIYTQEIVPFKSLRVWGAPPEDWMNSEFDDGDWAQLKGPFLIGKYKTPQYGYRSVPLLCLRGKFTIKASNRGLKLSVDYHGGLIVYVNGREIARRHILKGKPEPNTPAEDYPEDVYVDDKGKALNNKKPDTKYADRYAGRVRHLKGLVIPASVLRKGVNVLALELHRSPAREIMITRGGHHGRYFSWWSRIGLASVQLSYPGADAPSDRPAGFQVWTAPMYQEVRHGDFGNPCDSPGRIRLCTGRGGVVSGQAVLSSNAKLSGVKAEASDLRGPGTIPSSAIQIRYARLGWSRGRHSQQAFLELEEFPPESIATVPVWVTMRVPRDAVPGEYEGKVTVGASGQKAVDVPVKLKVVDWEVPDSKEFKHSFLEFIQSPESEAIYYKVPMWSEKHWELLDRAFSLLGEVGNKVVYITAQHKTHFGNEHSMIRYIKSGPGKYDYKPDFSIAEKYLDLAIKHQGKMPVVGLYIWRAPWVTGSYDGAGPRGDHKILITVKDPKTGALTNTEGPEWGTAECVEFWKPVIAGMKKICSARGIGGSLMMGQSSDYTPTDTALDTLDKAGGGDLLWIHHSHTTLTRLGNWGSEPIGSRKWKRAKGGKTYPVGMAARAWGGDGKHRDPDFGRGYGWKNRLIPWRTVTRESFHKHAVPKLRVRLEAMVTNIIHPKRLPKEHRKHLDYGTHGIGRMGADFWNVLGDKRKKPLCGRYTETRWGQLRIPACGQFFLRPGRDGAIATAQLECFRENAQEIEARVFIEKALEDKTKRSRLGADLATRARALLDNRTRLAQQGAQGSSRTVLALGVQELSEELYELTAEVSKKLGKQ